MADREDVYQRLVLEAVQHCGSDFAAIERYVADRIREMDEADKKRVNRAIALVLGFHEPAGPPYKTN